METHFYELLAKTERTHWWYAARREIVRWAMMEALEIAPQGGVIYDLGCGVGANLSMLEELGDVIGVDASDVAVANCHANGHANVRQANLETLDNLPPGSGRAVLLADVLEHLDDDAGCLAAIHRLLAPGGVLVITVPAFQALWGPNDDISQHRRRYRRRTLLPMLEKQFRVVHDTYFNTWLLPPIALGRLAQRVLKSDPEQDGRLPAAPVNELLRRIFRSELPVISRRVRLPAGVSFLAIAQRSPA